MKRARRTLHAFAFTLVELLVVIGIIALLISILIPVVGRVRRSAYVASSQASMRNIEDAITRYQLDQKAYPGPLAYNEIHNNPGTPLFASLTTATAAAGFSTTPVDLTKISGSENLVLGLIGGLKLNTAGQLVYDPSLVGNGALNLSAANPKRYLPYIDGTPLSWNVQGGLKTGAYLDEVSAADDTVIPEFVDSFPDPMPLLYLRARAGFTTANNTQADNNVVVAVGNLGGAYRLNDIVGYTSRPIGAGRTPVKNVTKNGSAVTYDPTNPHGLQAITPTSSLQKVPPSGYTYSYPYDAYAYFADTAAGGAVAQARSKDSYILIGAGADRVYGTEDDLVSFGSVLP